MALPREKDSYESYTDQIVYFSARLAAVPELASLAEPVDELLKELDDDAAALREARRAEVRARALRDHRDSLGDDQVRRFKRRVDVVGDDQLTQRLFPRGVAYATAPRGRPQIERLHKLMLAIEELETSPRVAAHPEVEEIKEILDKGKSTLGPLTAELTAAIESWEAQTLDVARAVDTFAFRRSDGVARLGAVMGELRAKLGGDPRAAYAFTQSARSGAGSANEGDAPSEGE